MPAFAPTRTPLATKTVTFTGASGLGLNGTTTSLFTVAGGLVRIVSISARPTTNTTVSNVLATLSVGPVGNVAMLIPAFAANLLVTTTPVVVSAVPTAGGLAIPAAAKDSAVAASIIATAGGTGDVTGGVVEFNVEWQPLTPGATLVAA